MLGKVLRPISIALAALIAISVAVFAYRLFIERAPQERGPEGYLTVVDLANRTVSIPKNISRVVAVGPGMLRLLVYLGALDLVVGVEEIERSESPLGRDYAMAFGEVLENLPVVGPGGPRSPPDPEKIRLAKPDLVIMYRGYVQLYDPDRLSGEVGAPVLVVDYGPAGFLDLDYLKKTLTLLGEVLGREDRARELCNYIDSIVDDLKTRAENVEQKPKIYVGAVSYKGKQPFTSSQSHFPPLTLLNTKSMADEVRPEGGFASLDFEYILQNQPDYIFIDLNNLDVVIDDFSKDSAKYCALKAFREGRVFTILPFNYYHTNIATALANAYFIGKVLYPERFADVDPVAKAREIYKVFLGVDIYDKFVKGFGRGFSSLSDVFSCGD